MLLWTGDLVVTGLGLEVDLVRSMTVLFIPFVIIFSIIGCQCILDISAQLMSLPSPRGTLILTCIEQNNNKIDRDRQTDR